MKQIMSSREKEILLTWYPKRKFLYNVFGIVAYMSVYVLILYLWFFSGPVWRGFTLVTGDSMEPTLKSDQIIFTSIEAPEVGDIVILNCPTSNWDYKEFFDETLIKRLIAGPGDTVSIKKDGVYVNGSLLREDEYTSGNTYREDIIYDYVTLGSNEYYFLGDNRATSLDSRKLGVVKASDIVCVASGYICTGTFIIAGILVLALIVASVVIEIIRYLILLAFTHNIENL